jgi:hypothetical protein
MFRVGKLTKKAGFARNLPFLVTVLAVIATQNKVAGVEPRPHYKAVSSRCIDLVHYDATLNQLTVRFRKTRALYQYSHVSSRVWTAIYPGDKGESLGTSFNRLILRHPEKYPFKLLGREKPPIHPEKANDRRLKIESAVVD